MAGGLSRARLIRQAGKLGLLVLMTDDDRLPDPAAAARALPRGGLVILRARDALLRRALAAQLMPLARARGLILLVADDAALARTASGLHLPEARARTAAAWRARNSHGLVTASAHSLAAVLRAARHADLMLLSPVFPTESHPGAPALGAARARLIARAAPLPVIALGGVSARNAVLLSGFAGIAAITGLTS